MTVTYELMMSQRTYFPDTIKRPDTAGVARTLEYLVERNRRNPDHMITVEVMMDQIDVYLKNQKIAVYMIA